EFTILYSFNDDHAEYAGNLLVTEAAEYAQRVSASGVRVSGFRGETVLSNGNHLVEKSGIAEKRARNVAELLRGSGVSGVVVEWNNESDAGPRRVTIRILR